MNKFKVLVADDDEFIREDIVLALGSKHFEIDTAQSGEEAFELFQQKYYHIVISDIQMQNEDDGFVLLEKIKKISPETVVMIITGFGDMNGAVKALRLGALDFITKPFDAEQVAIKAEKIAERVALTQKNLRMRKEISSRYEIVGESNSIQELKKQISIIAKNDSPVLITGPNGSGKELVAWGIRNQSDRYDKPFVIVNCAAIPEKLIEAELFGNVKGAFTGATKDKNGKFELANGGTIFLDEVGDMSLATQAKVLRVLDSGGFSRVGGEKSITVDVRVIAATNKNLAEMVEKGQFREDLYYRLNVIPVQTTPLKYRKEDIPALIAYMINKKGFTMDVKQLFSKEAIEYLKTLDWPGNVRQLNSVVERLIIYWDGETVDVEQAKKHALDVRKSIIDVFNTAKTIKEAVNDFEREFIMLVLDECKDNVTTAAEQLDLKRGYLYEKMKNLGIKR